MTDEKLTLRSEPSGKYTQGIIIPDDYSVDQTYLVVPPFYQPLIDRILISRGFIDDRIEKLAMDIHNHFKGVPEDIVLVCVLKSAALFYRSLSTALRNISKFYGVGADRESYKEFYLKATSYKGETRMDEVHVDYSIEKEYEKKLRGTHVVVVDDILDSGCTLKALMANLESYGAKSVNSVVLFSKRAPWNGMVPDWVGFDCPNEFVVGYGTDCDDHYRDLEHLCVASDHAKTKFGIN